MDNCYVDDENYFDYIVKYDYDLQGVYEMYTPFCVEKINNIFATFTKQITNYENEDFVENVLQFGYSCIPKLYKPMFDNTVTEDEIGGMFASESIRADIVRNLLDIDGTGVLVGIIDTGIDSYSSEFISQNSSRIVATWDQEKMLYDQTLTDEDGHGTYLASVIAGNTCGIAPKAELAIVKLKKAKRNLRQFWVEDDDNVYSEIDIMRGIRFLRNTAEKKRMPMVIIIAMGNNLGAHDGTTFLERYIETLGGIRGIAVISCTGNEMLVDRHSSGIRLNTESENGMWNEYRNIEINVEETSDFVSEIWGILGSEIELSIVSPSGEIYDSSRLQKNKTITHTFVYEKTTIDLYNQFSDKISGNQVIFVRWKNTARGIWKFQLREKKNYISTGFNCYISDKVRFLQPESEITITSPGNTEGTITIGCFNQESDAIYFKTGKGFTSINSIKPDICAPGVNIIGIMATNNENGKIYYIKKSGSSVSTAVTAGAAALLLQWGVVNKNAYMIGTREMKYMFLRGAVRKNTISYPTKEYGFGNLDLLSCFERIRQ